MRILITWGTKRGGTEGIARTLGDALREAGHDPTLLAAEAVTRVGGFDAVIVGGALYANRWIRSARRFVARHERELRHVPTWFFSSGPLDDSAALDVIPPPHSVAILMERVGALGHATFGGRLAPDAKGFIAAAMAKKQAGDWRDPARIRAWAAQIARALPRAKPGTPVAQPGRSWPRLAVHGAIGWALCATAMIALLHTTSQSIALVAHALLAPAIFAAIAWHYFAARGARTPVTTAAVFVGIVGALDVVVIAWLARAGVAMITSIRGFWLPLGLIFAVTLAIGTVSAIGPLPAPRRA